MIIAKINPSSLNNGKGCRMIIVFAGCSLNCDGCFSKELQDFDNGKCVSPKKLANIVIGYYLKNKKFLDGITLSGGNPQEQPELTEFLEEIRKLRPSLDIAMWSGFSWDEINNSERLKKHLDYVDFIVTGRFEKDKQVEDEFFGSSNQEVWEKSKKEWKKVK